MGEYATYRGSSIKIGTCEDCYYLRADQRNKISGYTFDADTLGVFRFRFPFPDEDGIEPGSFEDHGRGIKIPGWSLPEEFDDHGIVQFVAGQGQGYNLCIPCPEQFDGDPRMVELEGGGSLRVHRNGWNGVPRLVQQGYRDGELRAIVECGACGHKWNLTREHAEEVAVCFRSEADRKENRRGDVVFPEGDDYPKVGSYTDSPRYAWEYANGEKYRRELHEIADRLLAGYCVAA